MKCTQHNASFTVRVGKSQAGKDYIRWSCPEKDGDKFCEQGEWGRGKTISEEICNELRRMSDALQNGSQGHTGALQGTSRPMTQPEALSGEIQPSDISF